MGSMVLSGRFTVGSLLLPLCYKAPTVFTFGTGGLCALRSRRRGEVRRGAPTGRDVSSHAYAPGRHRWVAVPSGRPRPSGGQTRAAARLGASRTPTVRR
ncbi:hypothetical protein Sme01_30580 [Sphaerisporangium melleum]|uniref:Uncharacterized protein n=1 Tax=Sphaerisporangium melleum TaxID=321316 RepID=A0A917RMX3_9ACTN|nr:hypothetical protein GCM10007964_67850 [Sphaerisporangium melleum]GII70582.1 hypothetical protein Sme01_30580 [Sphaerisporangium melleum]